MMDSTKTSITLSTQNLNGFARNKDYLKSLCSQFPNSIRAIQEHWLKPPLKRQHGVNQLKLVHADFDGWGTSAMQEEMQTKIRIGRPYGGTGFLWHKQFSLALKPRLEYKHDRVTVMEINDKEGKIILINAYMPFYDASKIDSQLVLYAETLGFIEAVMEMNSDCSFILMSDLNCNIYDIRHPFSVLIRDLMQKRNLVSSFDKMVSFDPLSSWTRSGKRADGVMSYSLLDYILVSRQLLHRIGNVQIADYPNNLSDHRPVEMEIVLDLEMFNSTKNAVPKCISWKKVDGVIARDYESTMEQELDRIIVPHIVHGNDPCHNKDHIPLIEKYYCDIVNAIATADRILPRVSPTIQRDYWNEELRDLKAASIDAFNLWKSAGRPSSGVTFDMKKDAHYRYKLHVRKSQKLYDQSKNDALHNHLLEKNSTGFWRSWKSIHGSGQINTTRIDGYFKPNDIANCFADSFETVYHSNDPQRVSNLKTSFTTIYDSYNRSHVNDDISHYYLSWTEMLTIVDKITAGKATAGFIKYEHILHSSPKLIAHLQILFNSMIQHGYVPHDFLSGIITPIIKDAEGDASSTTNYRGLTLSVPFASMFEHAIILKIGHLLKTDNLQFGYKAKHSTSHALFVLRSCIDYFTSHGSNVFVAFLDCSKGFDKVDHYGIFTKLIEHGVPLCILNVIMYWYLNLSSKVKWGDSYSRSFKVTSGVRQGGILSPRIFTLYVDDLIITLRKSGVGCHIVDLFIAAIMYADDLALMAPTRSALQQLLDICHNYGLEWCITYNPTKTQCMIFGSSNECKPLLLNDSPIAFVNDCKYLGINVIAGKEFFASSKKHLSAFYCCSNTILNVLHGPSKRIQMKLLYSNCVPKLTYACEVRKHTSGEVTQMEVAVNDSIRKIHGYNRWESTRFLRESLGYKSITETFTLRRNSFLDKLQFTRNPVLISLAAIIAS